MAPSVAQTARIFEDPPESIVYSSSPKKSLSLWRSATKVQEDDGTQPLGERHINNPPAVKKVPLKDEQPSRPPMHKKSSSATSFKSLFGRDKSGSDDKGRDDKNKENKESKPKKTKSSTNLASLLKKRSKKDLKGEEKDDQNVPPVSPSKVNTPIWAQFATQPLEAHDGSRQYPLSHTRSPQLRSTPVTPLTYSDQHVSGQGLVHSYFDIDAELRMPQRPYLEKKGSRSSIFTEELHGDSVSTRPDSMDFGNVDRPEVSRHQSAESTLSTKEPCSPKPESPTKSKSRVFDAIAALNIKSKRERSSYEESTTTENPDSQDLDTALENVLGKYDIPHNLRDHMRNLKPEVKASLVKGERIGSGSSNTEEHLSSRSRESEQPSSKEKEKEKEKENEGRRSRSRSRPRSRVFSMSKKSKDTAPSKGEESVRSRSKSRPKSADLSSRPLSALSNMSTTSVVSMTANDGTSTPGDFIHYLREVQKPELVEVGKIHKLRILLRNETVQWTDVFVRKGGMDEIANLLHRIMKIEWREEHEDQLLHETLLCMKALTTTSLAMQRLEAMEQELFPALLKMLFDPERKGPAEFSTRAVVISLLFVYLSTTLQYSQQVHERRTRAVLALIRDQHPDGDKQPLDFVTQMHTSRPYRVWCKEITNVTKEVFWIFLHHMNVVPVTEPAGDDCFARKYYPAARAPHPAAPYVGGVEWEATQYLATHLDLVNGLIVSLPTRQERNAFREELRQSGFEKVMGGTLRTCKEKFYAGVHDGLRCWVSAARADGWAVEDVRAGPPRDASPSKPKSPSKKHQEAPPQLKLDVGVPHKKVDEGWL